ncbi:MAG: bactofilin family protein [bacterium]
MFGKEGDQQAAVSSILGSGCKFTGDVDAKGTIRIDGEFQGKVVATEGVIVGKTGIVRGEIHSTNVAITGTVEGNIIAKRKVELESGAKLIGDVESMSLVIEDGVFFEGKSKMRREGEGFAPRARVAKPEETKEEVPVKDR